MAYKGWSVIAIGCLLVLLTTLGNVTVDAMECFTCTNARNVSECHSTAYCRPDEVCSMNISYDQGLIRYTLGCVPVANCSGVADTLVGRRATSFCHECCSTDYCNKKLCMHSGGTQSQVCHDDPQYNCALVATTFDICSDINHAKLVCKKHCQLCTLVDGHWSTWTPWSNCDKTCGIGGMQLRMRACDNPSPAHGGSDCLGQMMETSSCSNGPCPVNGGWSAWAHWSTCDSTCDLGHTMRVRHCNNPSPAHGGAVCAGVTSETKNCTVMACPVDGAWAHWSQWSDCDRTCEQGTKLRTRTCTNPAPAHGGRDCTGSKLVVTECTENPLHCPIDGGWAIWTMWSSCSMTCGAGLHHRGRNCSRPIPMHNGSPCFGSSEEYKVCVQQGCSDGGWSSWSSWTSCSVSCDGGLMSRARSCDNPHPSVYGKACEGSGEEYVTCNRQNCPVESVFFTVDTPTPSLSYTNQLNFTQIVTNEGHGYNPDTGVFTASIPGIYHVSLTVNGNSHATSSPLCVIKHNSDDVATIHTHAGTTSSSSAYVQMVAGDVMGVFCDGSVAFIDADASTIFSGALVMKMR